MVLSHCVGTGTEPGSSARTSSLFLPGATSPAPKGDFLAWRESVSSWRGKRRPGVGCSGCACELLLQDQEESSFCFLVVLGTQSRDLCVLGRCSPTEVRTFYLKTGIFRPRVWKGGREESICVCHACDMMKT